MNTVTIDSIKELPEAQYIKTHLCTSCLVCGESVALTQEEEYVLYHGHHVHSKICNECRSAILYMRHQMEQKEN